jgi:hypothetical protein
MNFLQSLTAEAAMRAKEEKSLTATAAEDAMTSPSMEWPHLRRHRPSDVSKL